MIITDTRSKYIDDLHTDKRWGRAISSQPAPCRKVGGAVSEVGCRKGGAGGGPGGGEGWLAL